MKNRYLIPVILTALPLFALGLFSLFDTDATYSDREKRELAQFPEFSLSAYADASFMQDFESYYSDTFPGRETLMAGARSLRSTVLLTGLIGGEDIMMLPSSQTVAVVPDAGNSSDTAHDDTAQNLSGIMYYSGRLMEVFAESDTNLTAYSETVNALSEQAGVPFYIMMPTPAYTLYSPEAQRADGTDFSAAAEKLKGLLNGPVLLDTDSTFKAHKDEYIYFRTDHHWTAKGAYYAASVLADTLDTPIPPLDKYSTGKVDNFLGSLYNSAATQSVSSKFDKNGDSVEYFIPKYGYTVNSYASINLDDPEARSLVVPDFSGDSNLYNIFCGGDMPIAHIKSENKNGTNVFVIRDSYGHALLPFLCDMFENVYAVDPRYYSADNTLKIADFVSEYDIDCVLLLNYPHMAIGGYWIEFSPYLKNLLK